MLATVPLPLQTEAGLKAEARSTLQAIDEGERALRYSVTYT